MYVCERKREYVRKKLEMRQSVIQRKKERVEGGRKYVIERKAQAKRYRNADRDLHANIEEDRGNVLARKLRKMGKK